MKSNFYVVLTLAILTGLTSSHAQTSGNLCARIFDEETTDGPSSSDGDSGSSNGASPNTGTVSIRTPRALRDLMIEFIRVNPPGPLAENAKAFAQKTHDAFRRADPRYPLQFHYTPTSDGFSYLDTTPLREVTGKYLIMAADKAVVIHETRFNPGRPPTAALARTVDGQVVRVPYDLGEPPSTSTLPVRIFGTEAPVIAIKAISVASGDPTYVTRFGAIDFTQSGAPSNADVGVIAVDRLGHVYFQTVNSRAEVQRITSIKVKRANGEELSRDELAKVAVTDLLPTNLVISKSLVTTVDSMRIVRREVSYLSSSGLQVTLQLPLVEI